MYVIRYHGLYLASDVDHMFTELASAAQHFDTMDRASVSIGYLCWHATSDETPRIDYSRFKIEERT